jgi:dihydropteroate synthase
MFTLNCKGRLACFNEPVVMGIINTTPDSFYAGSRLENVQEIVERAGQMIHDGATFLDVGGQSTRPGSRRITEEEEIHRVIPAIQAIHQAFPEQLISVDTFYSKVAIEAVHSGACLVNDVTAGTIDASLIPSVIEMDVPYVLMHMRGRPETMQEEPEYENVTQDVFDFLSFKTRQLIQGGMKDIIVDPGFGFGKNRDHNFQLLRDLSVFRQLEKPLMVGVSRKATIYKTLDISSEEALNGSTVLHTIALMNGAQILRVHDVLEAVQAVKLYSATMG